MADIEITIPLPILVGTEKFKVRYRLLPAGIFTAYQDETNAPFTLTGLAVGTYEIEYIYVKEDATECEAVTDTFEIIDEYECIDFFAEMQQIGSLYNVQITYTPPVTQPPCGWIITWVQGLTASSIPYASLPVSGVINIAVPTNADVTITITASNCNGNILYCFDEVVEGIPETNCEPAILVSADLIYNGPTASFPNSWFIRVQVINSNPFSTNYQMNVSEISNTGSLPPDNGTFIIAATPVTTTIFYGNNRVYPKGIFLQGSPDEYLPNCIIYNGVLIDECGGQHPFTVRGYWTPSTIAGQGTFDPNAC